MPPPNTNPQVPKQQASSEGVFLELRQDVGINFGYRTTTNTYALSCSLGNVTKNLGYLVKTFGVIGTATWSASSVPTGDARYNQGTAFTNGVKICLMGIFYGGNTYDVEFNRDAVSSDTIQRFINEVSGGSESRCYTNIVDCWSDYKDPIIIKDPNGTILATLYSYNPGSSFSASSYPKLYDCIFDLLKSILLPQPSTHPAATTLPPETTRAVYNTTTPPPPTDQPTDSPSEGISGTTVATSVGIAAAAVTAVTLAGFLGWTALKRWGFFGGSTQASTVQKTEQSPLLPPVDSKARVDTTCHV